jgi:ABC-type amino acid transport substrate-binding protein
MSRFFIITLLFFLQITLFANSQINDQLTKEEKKWLDNHKVIKVYNETDWAPYNFNLNGKPQGYSVDFIKLLASKLGLKIEFIDTISWNDALQDLQNAQIDVVTNIAKTKPRMERFNYTDNWYLKIQNGFISLKNTTPYNSFEELNGKTVAVVKGYASHELIKEKYPNIKLYLTDNNTELIKAVAYGKADAANGTLGVLQYLMSENFIANLQYSESQEPQRSLYLAIGKHNPILLSLLNKAQNSLSAYEISELKEKWLFVHANAKKIEFTQTELLWMKNNPVINVGGEMDWPPFDYVDNGQYAGIAKDYLDLLASKTGLRFNVKTGDTWDVLLQKTKEGKLDLLPMIYYTKERTGFLNFTKPYLNIRHYIYSREDSTFENFRSLFGKTVAIPKGFAQSEIMKQKYPDIKILEVKNPLECIDAVVTKRADAFIENTALVTYLLKHNKIKGIKASFATDLGVNKLYMATNSSNILLKDIIQKVLDSLTKDEIQTISKKWLYTEDTKKMLDLNIQERKWLENNSITIGIEDHYPPLSFKNNLDQLDGLIIEYIKHISELLGKPIHIRPERFSKSLQNIEKSTLNGVINIYHHNQNSKLLQTHEFFTAPFGLITQNNTVKYQSLKELKDKIIVVKKSSLAADFLAKDYPQIKLLSVRSYKDALSLVIEGKADGVFGNLPILVHSIKKHLFSDLKINFIKFDDIGAQRILLNPNEPILMSIFNKAINQIDIKTKEKIADKYLQLKIEQTLYDGLLINVLFIAIAIILLLLLLSYLLKMKIRKEANKKLKFQNYAKEFDTIINSSWTIQILNDGFILSRTNKAFEKFFDMYKNYNEFKQYHQCISEYFEPVDDGEYVISDTINGEHWITYLLREQHNKQYKIAIKKDDILNHFIIHVNEIILQNKHYYLLELINISHEIEQRKEIEEKNKIIAQQSKMSALGEMIGNIAHQ